MYYIIVKENSSDELVKKVNEKLNQGYELVRGVSCMNTVNGVWTYCQAMISK